jgi:mannosyltransferase
MVQSFLRHKNQFWLFVALALGFALRVYALGAQSLWNDEGNSVALAPLSLEAIANAAAHDIHPPLYYFLLHFWVPLAGNTEYAIRFLSVIAGLLVVAVTFRFAYLFFDEEIAIVAAFLSAFSAFQVYYSQEARMYIWVTLWSLVSVLAMAVMLKRNDARVVPADETPTPPAPRRTRPASRTTRSYAWLVYIVATIAALYTQYFAASMLPAENAEFALWLFLAWRDKRANMGHSIVFWLAAQAIVVLAIAPWYLSVRDQLAAWPAISDSIDLPTLLWRVLNVFSVGTTLDAATSLPIAAAFGVLLFASIRWTRDAQTDFAAGALGLALISPIGVMYAISVSRPAYNPKFLLLATPAFFILAARGMARIYPGLFLRQRYAAGKRSSLRWFYFLVGVLVAVGFVPSLRNYYFNPAYARDDYRSIVQFVDAIARPGDGLLVDAPGQIDVVRYYLRGDPQLFLLPRMRPPDPTATHADVDDMLAKAQRLFAIYYATEQSDPQSLVETQLAQNAFKARDEWHGNVRLAVYGVAPTTRAAAPPLNAKIGTEITLAGFQLDQRDARAGDILTLTLHWRAEQSPSARYKVFVHLLNAGGQVVAQRDGEPVADTRITTTWKPGEEIDDNYGILVDAGTPAGAYQVEIGMYRADDGVRLPITSSGGQKLGDHLSASTVQIAN